MKTQVIFHHYPASPFSEKVRVVFGIKQLEWRSVEIPNMMPKPDLMPLTGGYRKTPVLQIGADIYCDTQIIIRELERRFGDYSVFGSDKGLGYAVGFWADKPFFMASVPVIFGELGPSIPEEFKKDRAKLSEGTFSTDAMAKAAPYMRDQWRAHASFLSEQLADGRSYLNGNKPAIADAHGYMNVWFQKNTVPHIADSILKEFPKLDFWQARVSALGHGKSEPMDAKEALVVAKEASPEAKPADDPFETRGRKPGDKVKVMADDYGRDPVEGTIVFTNAQEIAIARNDPAVGDVVVHFPRAGFMMVDA
jgi:glutathione S-transferase